MTLKDWKRDGAARAKWDDFLRSPEGRAGIAVLLDINRPIVVMGESLHSTALRQAYQAGFDACIRTLERISSIQTVATQKEVLPDWEHIDKPNHTPLV